MSVCGDFGGVTAKGEPCQHTTDGLCWAHREDGNPGGRPSGYDPEMCHRVIALGRDGAGRAEIAADLDISRQTLANWEAAHPEFLDATTRASDLAAAWWATQGRKGIWSREFNASAYRLQVMNRFPDDWRDKQSLEHTGEDGGPIETRMVRVPVVEKDADTWSRRFRPIEPEEVSTGGNGNGRP